MALTEEEEEGEETPTVGVLDGKTAIVTGAGRGIGRGIARALAKEGANVAVPDIDSQSAARVAGELEELGVASFGLRCDVRESSEVDEFVAATAGRFPSIDILVNNAMAAHVGVPLESIADTSIALALSTGPAATLYFMRACYPHLAGRDGRIINLRSGSEVQGLDGYATYIAAKAAIGGITRTAAREWGRRGITVNAVCPFSLSEGARAHFDRHPEALDRALEHLSIPRSGDAEAEIGRAVVFLAGPDASFITGCTISIDGGGNFLG